MTCTNCQKAQASPHWGGYDTRCARCCARLVRSARPVKAMQEAMLYAIALRPENPTKATVLAALKAMDAEAAAQGLLPSFASNTNP